MMAKYRLKPVIIGHRCEGWQLQVKRAFWWFDVTRSSGSVYFLGSNKEAGVELMNHLNQPSLILKGE